MTTVNNRNVSPPSGKDEDQKEKGFFNRPRAGGKTLWDWLNLLGLLAIPLVVAGATLLFSIQQANLAQQQHENDQKIANQQHQADQQRALDQQQAAILQTYIDKIQDLLLNQNLLKASSFDIKNPYYDTAILARARTLIALRGLDPERKGLLVQFLYESTVIGHSPLCVLCSNVDPVFDLRGADLRGAELSGAELSGANLDNADLTEANLDNTNLDSASLSGAHLDNAHLIRGELDFVHLDNARLIGADLTHAALLSAILKNAKLVGARLDDAALSGVDLTDANLSGAKITQYQLDLVLSCDGATLPKGLTCHRTSPP